MFESYVQESEVENDSQRPMKKTRGDPTRSPSREQRRRQEPKKPRCREYQKCRQSVTAGENGGRWTMKMQPKVT